MVSVSQKQLLEVTCPLMVVTSLCVFARIGIQIWRRRAMESQDYLLYAGFVFYLAMSICYIIIAPMIILIDRVTEGQIEPWPTMMADIAGCIRMIFVTTALFWLSLWSVKWSLLALYKRLTTGLPAVYTQLWWAVFTFCAVGLVGCFISYVVSCPDFAATLSTGNCGNGERSVRGQLASLYASYAVDIISDLMIMFLPIRLVWNLRIPRGQKIAIIGLFASGFICIAFATLRVVQIGLRAGSKSPGPAWLALWTMIESSVALCIGCGPAFAALYRSTTQTPHVSYDMHGYIRHPQSGSSEARNNLDAIKMRSITNSTARMPSYKHTVCWDDTKSSQEELAAESRGIIVTTTLEQQYRRSAVNEA